MFSLSDVPIGTFLLNWQNTPHQLFHMTLWWSATTVSTKWGRLCTTPSVKHFLPGRSQLHENCLSLCLLTSFAGWAGVFAHCWFVFSSVLRISNCIFNEGQRLWQKLCWPSTYISTWVVFSSMRQRKKERISQLWSWKYFKTLPSLPCFELKLITFKTPYKAKLKKVATITLVWITAYSNVFIKNLFSLSLFLQLQFYLKIPKEKKHWCSINLENKGSK